MKVQLTKEEVVQAAKAYRAGSDGSDLRSFSVRAVLAFSKAIKQPVWERGADGQSRDTGKTVGGLDAIEALQKGFGKGKYRTLALDSGTIDAVIEGTRTRRARENLAELYDAAYAVNRSRNAEIDEAFARNRKSRILGAER